MPLLVSGSIALKVGRADLARSKYAAALERDPRDFYANLELGAIASQAGDRATALARLERASVLSPRDRLVAGALAAVRRGRRLDVGSLNRAIVERARQTIR